MPALQVVGFQLLEETEADLCSADPWIVLHKLDSPSKMRYVGARVEGCKANASAAVHVVPPSIAPWVARIGALLGSPIFCPPGLALVITF